MLNKLKDNKLLVGLQVSMDDSETVEIFQSQDSLGKVQPVITNRQTLMKDRTQEQIKQANMADIIQESWKYSSSTAVGVANDFLDKLWVWQMIDSANYLLGNGVMLKTPVPEGEWCQHGRARGWVNQRSFFGSRNVIDPIFCYSYLGWLSTLCCWESAIHTHD